MRRVSEQKSKILVICPSRGRPKLCGRLIDSFLATSKMSTLSISLDNDDPFLNEYIDVIGGRVPYTIDIRKTTTQIINDKWRFSSECFKYFSITNDDFIYKTVGWDEKLVLMINLHGGNGIAYGNDLLARHHIPTTSVISRDIVLAVGWLQLPTLTHLFGDNVWGYIGQQAGCLYYNDNVVIEHCHAFANKMEKDQTHLETNSNEMYARDEAMFNQWIINQSREDIQKVKVVICRKYT